MGFDGFFFARLDHDDKRKRLREKSMEMIWRPRRESSLFTGALYGPLYGPPKGFCFESRVCDDPQVVDDPDSKEFNVKERVRDLEAVAKDQADHYLTNHVMLTMGMDFNFVNARSWFKNMDKLIKWANLLSSEIHVLYSTPSCYLQALNNATKLPGRSEGVEWPEKTDDFFPYSSDPHAYWTGFFTSRPTLKYMVRNANNALQICKQMSVYLASKNGGAKYDAKVEHCNSFSRFFFGFVRVPGSRLGFRSEKVTSM